MRKRFDGKTYDETKDGARLMTALQKTLSILLDGKWHTLTELRDRAGPSADSRVRDLRKSRLGGFAIECERAADVGLPGFEATDGTWCYRLKIPSKTPPPPTNPWTGNWTPYDRPEFDAAVQKILGQQELFPETA